MVSLFQQEVKEGEEKLELKRGAFVLIVSGKHADLYGEVEGLDEDNARFVPSRVCSQCLGVILAPKTITTCTFLSERSSVQVHT